MVSVLKKQRGWWMQVGTHVHVQSLSRVRLFLTPWTGSSVRGDSPGKNTGVCCHALLQGIFLTQGSDVVSCVSCFGSRVLYR